MEVVLVFNNEFPDFSSDSVTFPGVQSVSVNGNVTGGFFTGNLNKAFYTELAHLFLENFIVGHRFVHVELFSCEIWHNCSVTCSESICAVDSLRKANSTLRVLESKQSGVFLEVCISGKFLFTGFFEAVGYS